MTRLIPDTIVTRTLLVLVLGLMLSHVLSVALHMTDRLDALESTGGEHIGERIATIGRLVEDAAPEERRRIVELADYPDLHVAWSEESWLEAGADLAWKTDVFHEALAAHLKDRSDGTFHVRYADRRDNERWLPHFRHRHSNVPSLEGLLLVSFELRDKGWLNFAASIEPAEPFWSLRFTLSMAVMLLAVGGLSVLVVHHLTKPLGIFVRAAQRLGTDVRAPSIPEEGPAEVRQAINAFNQMQDRIRRFVEDRTQMLAAISHDLGTPITRLRLRAELVEDADQRSKMLADLDDMEKMVLSALSFARDEATSEPHGMVDLRTLLQRVCTDIGDAGNDVELKIGSDPAPYGCRPIALRRALGNLIENAVKYGNRAHVSLIDADNDICVEIDDDGPGIPEDLQEEAFRPFHRLESSRNRETGGTGLGLTVARTIIRAHGGELSLRNRCGGGLRAEVRLPR